MKVVVLGAGGMLGHKLTLYLRREFKVITTTRGSYHEYSHLHIFNKDDHISNFDVLNEKHLFQLLDDQMPDAIINCIGMTTRKITNDLSPMVIKINSVLPHQLESWACKNRKKVIHFSTDCVFSGQRGNYKEDDLSDVQDLYGMSKRLGEIESRCSLTIRSSIIGQEIAHFTELISWIISQKGQTVKGYKNAFYTGVTTNYMAYFVREFLRQRLELYGLYQLASPKISKYDLIELVNNKLELDIKITPDEGYKADKSLDGSRLFEAVKNVDKPDWNTMIDELKWEHQFYTQGNFHDFKR
ncbi:MAG: sugar nucleotide-binding protein [Bdellovibrionales bacterium]|nr:sugar nucleotide-binding protein [Bdellovibrionales bacterium]